MHGAAYRILSAWSFTCSVVGLGICFALLFCGQLRLEPLVDAAHAIQRPGQSPESAMIVVQVGGSVIALALSAVAWAVVAVPIHLLNRKDQP